MNNGNNTSDKKIFIQAFKEHIACFGEPPDTYGFDRGGHSQSNIKKLNELNEKNFGLAPAVKTKWQIFEKIA